MSQQQTVLRVQFGNASTSVLGDLLSYEILDLYSDIPIKINKSFAELEDISKRNSDYSIGLSLPGSKKNNKFFENYFNVDTQSLYFNAQNRVNCQVLLSGEAYFTGYMRLNKVSVLDSKIEYSVTLYSTVGDLFGQIGNNLLKDLDFNDSGYTFNHTFGQAAVSRAFYGSNFYTDGEQPYPYFYPVVHNGYNYVSESGATLPNFTGTTSEQTRLYTSTSPIGAWPSYSAATASGVTEFHINSINYGLRDNQLKPALSIWNLIKLMFKTYGYSIKSTFFNTPWMKSLYLYGYFSSEGTKFSLKLNNIETLPLSGCEIIFLKTGVSGETGNAIVCKRNTGIPCYCLDDISGTLLWSTPLPYYFDSFVIQAGATGYTASGSPKVFSEVLSSSSIPHRIGENLRYFPVPVGSTLSFQDGDAVDFSLVIDQNIKQIDLLSSIAKKFNLIFIPDPDNVNQIIIEPYDFYMGTGDVYDWTDKLSYDKGWTVEPVLNYLESQLTLTDLEDGDEGNKIFKFQNNRIYGQNWAYNPTDFKSTEKRIETIFSPELIRKWDDNIGLPLGINYTATNEISSADNQVRWIYKGVKSKPKLMFWLSGYNPFIDKSTEVYTIYPGFVFNTYSIKLAPSSTGTTIYYDNIPSISHTMPMGLADDKKINNDSLCILFNSELPTDTIGVQTYNTYTENDIYTVFYNNRISNLYNENTRFLTGHFNLKYNDIKNLKPNDLIKIQNQYFVWNKVKEYNLTNRELTEVELIQYKVNTQTYPNRYFEYYYCDNPSRCFKFQTDFTNPNLLDTNFIWSLYYDHQVGSIPGQTSGFSSTFRIFKPQPIGTPDYVDYTPYTMYEVSQDDYNNDGCLDWTYDPVRNYVYSYTGSAYPQYCLATFWESTGYTGANVFADCATFSGVASTYGIRVGSSTYFGPVVTPTPTPTLTTTPTPTPTPTPSMVGTLVLTYEDYPDGTDFPLFYARINGVDVYNRFVNSYELATIPLHQGDTMRLQIYTPDNFVYLSVTRRDFTDNSSLGTNGIYDTFITGVTGDTNTYIEFTIPNLPQDYNFEYRLNCGVIIPPVACIVTSGLTVYNTGLDSQSYSGGTTWYSVSGATYNGTIHNAPTFGGNPKAFTFNGVDQWIDYPTGATLSDYTSGITFGGWVKAARSNEYLGFYQRNLDSPSLALFKTTDNTFGGMWGYGGPGTPGAYFTGQVTGTTVMNTDDWYYLTLVWYTNYYPYPLGDPHFGVKLYVNGNYEASYDNVGNPHLYPSTGGWNIGRYNDTDWPRPTDDVLYGAFSVSDFEVYNRQLSQTEILYNFHCAQKAYGYGPYVTPTPTPTPSPTPTPAAPTFEYRYIYTIDGVTSKTKSASNLTITISDADGSNLHTYSAPDVGPFTIVNHTSGPLSTSLGDIGGSKRVTVYRDLCKNSESTVNLAARNVKMWIDGILYVDNSMGGDGNLIACSSGQLTDDSYPNGPFPLAYNSVIYIEWTDTEYIFP